MSDLLDLSTLRADEQAQFKMRSLYKQYGYSHYKMNKFEEYELYSRNMDFLISDAVITFTGSDGKLLALKPDVTLSIVKNAKDDSSSLQKVFYNENVYRKTGGSNEFREIMQTGIECIGNIDLYCIYEVILLALKSLALICDDFILDISHMGIIKSVLKSCNVDYDTENAILKCIAQKNSFEIGAICDRKNIQDPARQALVSLARIHGKLSDCLVLLKELCFTDEMKEIHSQLEKISSLICTSGFDDFACLDFSVTENLKYYSGITFKGYIKNIPVSVLSGGRYDNLLKRMHKKGGAIGFAVYLDTLERLSTNS